MDQGLIELYSTSYVSPYKSCAIFKPILKHLQGNNIKRKIFIRKKMLMILYEMMCRHIIVIKDTTEDFSVMDTIVNVLKKCYIHVQGIC